MKKIKLIVFSSFENIKMAEEIQERFHDSVRNSKYSCKLWTDDFFKLSSQTLGSLQSIKVDVDFAIVILSPDDDVVSKGENLKSPRDNVIFEAGLCIGILGLERTIIVDCDNIKLPSDMRGLTTCRVNSNENIKESAKSVVKRIENYIENATTGEDLTTNIYWEEYKYLIDKFLDKIKKSDHEGSSHYYNAIVSISRSGTMLAELVGRTYGYNMPVFQLVKDRGKNYGKYNSDDVKDRNLDVVKLFNKNNYKDILVIDGMAKSERAISEAMRFLDDNCENINFKAGTLIADSTLRNSRYFDFVAEYRDDTKNIEFFYKVFRWLC